MKKGSLKLRHSDIVQTVMEKDFKFQLWTNIFIQIPMTVQAVTVRGTIPIGVKINNRIHKIPEASILSIATHSGILFLSALLKADFNVEKAILCIRIKFAALFSKINSYVKHENNGN